MNNIEALREKYARPALLFEPTSKSHSSLLEPRSIFGNITHQLPSESWPTWEGRPLCPLLQLNLKDVPFLPRGLQGLELLTLFVRPDKYPQSTTNNTEWALRAYSSLELLVPASPSPLNWSVKSQPLDFPRLVEDYPCFEDVEEEPETWEEFEQHHVSRDGIKVGGWPRLIQSSIYWAPYEHHPAQPEYVLQVDSMVELNWSWGDAGCAYIGRGTTGPQKNEFFLDWQCY